MLTIWIINISFKMESSTSSILKKSGWGSVVSKCVLCIFRYFSIVAFIIVMSICLVDICIVSHYLCRRVYSGQLVGRRRVTE